MTRLLTLVAHRAVAIVFPPTGLHRKGASLFPPAPRAAIVPQTFVSCRPCGVDTAATVHGGITRCAEGHEQEVAS